jgi:hypothetical protein
VSFVCDEEHLIGVLLFVSQLTGPILRGIYTGELASTSEHMAQDAKMDSNTQIIIV